MSVLSNRRILVLAIGAFAAPGPAGLSASAAPSRSSGNEESVGKSSQSVRGPRGPRGFRGLTGKRGLKGTMGLKGNQGNQGNAGTAGVTGAAGAEARSAQKAHRASPARARLPSTPTLQRRRTDRAGRVQRHARYEWRDDLRYHADGRRRGDHAGEHRRQQDTFSVSGTETSQFALFNGATSFPARSTGQAPAPSRTLHRRSWSPQPPTPSDTLRTTPRVPQFLSR